MKLCDAPKSNKWIKKTEKHTRYKIYHNFKYNPALKSRYPTGSILYLYDHKDKLVFIILNYRRNGEITNFFPPGVIGVLKYKKGQFNFFLNWGGKWKNTSNDANKIMKSFSNMRPRKIHAERIIRVVKKFANKFNRKFEVKASESSIASGIIKLCYPALEDLAPETEVVARVFSPYCCYMRNPNSHFVKKLKKQNIEGKIPRYFRIVYMSENDPGMWRMINQNFKYIKLSDQGCTYNNDDGSRGLHCWSKEHCEQNLKNGKLKEIPLAEVALME